MWRHLIHGCQQHMGSSCIDMHDIGHFTVGQARTLLEQMGTLDSESETQLEIAAKFIAKEESDRERRKQLIGKDEQQVFVQGKEMEEDSFDIWNKSTRAGPDPHANKKTSAHNRILLEAAAVQVKIAQQGNATDQFGKCWNCKTVFDQGHLDLTRESPKEGMVRCAQWHVGCGAWYCTKDCLKEHARGRGKGRCDKEPHEQKCPVVVDIERVVGGAGTAGTAASSSASLHGFRHPGANYGGSGGSYSTNVNFGGGGGSGSSRYSHGGSGGGGGGAGYNANSNYGSGSGSGSNHCSYSYGSGGGAGGAGYNGDSSYGGGGSGGSSGYGGGGGGGYGRSSGCR